MEGARWQKVDRIFAAALERAPAERAAFLDAACAGDESLRREVESLIEHDREGDFLEEPAVAEAARVISAGAPSPADGESIGHYRDLRRLGAGGMGEVFLARDERLNRPAAIKLLSAHLTGDEERVRRFRQEALAASALNHPNILTIYETGQWRGRDYIVTEYVEGATLRTLIRGKRLDLAAAIDIALQIADALSGAHGAGIVHRDIKPENIMVRPDGRVKVLDFGIAKYTEGPRGRSAREALFKTATGAVVGTAAYMSPEQARGSQVDERTDVWSLGVILYEMVARRLPFPGPTPTDRVAAILTKDPVPLSRLRRGVPAELERIVGRALAKRKEERYARMADLYTDLLKLRATLGEARPPRFAPPLPAGGLRPLSRPRAVALAAIALAAVAAVAGWAYFRKGGGVAGGGAIDSLAVLPFANDGGGADGEYLSDGITESLINSFSELPNLKVMSRNSVFRYKGRGAEVQAAARELGVRAVLTGRVAQRGDTLAVSVELTDARDNRHLWGEQYSRKLSDIFAVQREIARDISARLRARLTGEQMRRVTRSHTDNVEAYQLYLRGRSEWGAHTRQSLRASVEYYERAVALDPDYALAYGGLAHAYGSLANQGAMPPNEGYLKAKMAAEKAVELDDSLPEGHAAVAFVKTFYEWDWEGARRASLRAIELNPNSSLGHALYADYLTVVGRLEDALAETKREQELDPLHPLTNMHLANSHLALGRYDDAVAWAKRAIELDPKFPVAYQILGSAYVEKGMHAEGIATFEEALKVVGREPSYLALVGHAHAVAGRRAEALKLLGEMQAAAERRHVPAYWFALVHAGLGDKDKTFAWLDKAFAERFFLLKFLKVDPRFAYLRPDPRFAALLERMGLPAD